MLDQTNRILLAETVLTALPTWQDCRRFVESIKYGTWNALPMQLSYTNAVPDLVNAAESQGWLDAFVSRLVSDFPGCPRFADVLAAIRRNATPATDPDPFNEVLLDGCRPFVNRQDLRACLRNLTDPQGEVVLRIEGEPGTGKSFSYYLINHVAPAKGYAVHKFEITSLQKPGALALNILSRIGADRPIPPVGLESAERWAEKLCDIVKCAIEERNTRRLFVFDGFRSESDADDVDFRSRLSAGTASLIVRLAKYADEELRQYLRVVLVAFPVELPRELDDVTPRDAAAPFTNADMVTLITQVATARKWSVNDAVVKAKVDEFHQMPRTLNERFKFLRGLLKHLEAAA